MENFLKATFVVIIIYFSYGFLISKYINHLRKLYRLKSFGVKVSGKIMWNEESKISAEYKKYYQLVEYIVNDNSYQVFISFETYEARKIGENVEVLYDPKNPIDAIVIKPSGKALSFFIIFFWIFFIVIFIYFLSLKSIPNGTAPIYP